MGASLCGVVLEIPPWLILRSNQNPLSGFGTLHGGQFDWGGRLPKRNGGVRRFAQVGRISTVECNGKSKLDCETYMSSRDESRS